MRPLAVIGGGRMGEAIVAGLLAAGIHSPADIVIAEPDESRRRALLALDVATVEEAAQAAEEAEVVLLAVKPQVIGDVVAGLAAAIAPGTLVVSIAAGVPCSRLESLLPSGTPVVRVMPNTPALVSQGMAVISGGEHASDAQIEQVRRLFGALGRAIVLPESGQDAATAISGSGPAYFALFADALAAAGEAHGLSRDDALALAVQTMKGTAVLLEDSGQSPRELIAAVSSPGGTTVAALAAFEDAGFADDVAAAVDAAVRRASELGR